ncbi:ATP-binding protein [Chelatococcus asaccharovorans]|uniref:histidine kinase n=1 Tax=Chelatococcus asaccharovorans TaxID=28210 RepID=A0A2V3TU58_9HYPH|nr:ATP-binding protein [Chelatococcus asaccharovorans]PXW51351.1 PAS domain S-box-containing protein [Chelatococcus asaccharovorans]
MTTDAFNMIWLSPWLGGAIVVVAATLIALAYHARRVMARRLAVAEAEIIALVGRNQALLASEARYRSLAEVRSEFILRYDGDRRITYANEAFAKLMGYEREDLKGAPLSMVIKEIAPSGHGAARSERIEAELETAQGMRWIAWDETAIETSRGPEWQLIGRDETDRLISERALEEGRRKAEAANVAKSRFLATVSHEVRTPLNGILGMADLLGETQLDPEQATYVRAIRTSGDVLLSLIDEILDFSKIEAGKMELTRAPFNLRALVESVVELLAPRAQGKDVEIAAYIAEDVPVRIMGDADRLRQVLMNLAGNAVKFTDRGGVGIRAELAGEGRLRISVLDTGTGIPASRLQDIFGEFEQVDEPSGRRQGGTGLGLAISRRIAEGMNGTISVESVLGKGSTFSVDLPLEAAPETDPADAIERPDLAGQRILIAADSPFEAPFLAAQLTAAGGSLTVLGAEEQAISAMAEGVDIAIIDYALGDERARRLAAAARKAGAWRTIILLSPFERRDIGLPSAAGFDVFLIKPVRSRSLFQQIDGWVSGEPVQHQNALAAERMVAGLQTTGQTARVLLAEDNEINALLTLKALEHFGAKVDWARDGRRALGFAKGMLAGRMPAYDLALLDVRMPEMDGLEVVRQIRALEVGGDSEKRLPIVMLTANAFTEDRQAALSAGADGFLAKPLDRAKLKAWLPARQQREVM